MEIPELVKWWDSRKDQYNTHIGSKDEIIIPVVDFDLLIRLARSWMNVGRDDENK